jgi:hypothetical protein
MISLRSISYLPYKLTWSVWKLLNKHNQVDFLCGGYVDYICFRNIHKLMPNIRIVSRSNKTKKELASYGIKSTLYPTYPDTVIMARHLARKYPVGKIVKIGMRHGAYHFKDFIAAENYNAFDVFMLTSSQEVKVAESKGITSGVAVGFPKIDPIFNGEITMDYLDLLKTKLKLNNAKKTILFTATWDKKGYSAVDKWYLRVEELALEYNVLVTVHHWLSAKYKKHLASNNSIRFIEDKDILPYLMLADVMVADISSIIAEFCALDKPIITFKLPVTKRFTQEIINMLGEISYRIDSFDELDVALKKALAQPKYHSHQRAYYNQIMFDELDGKASARAADLIIAAKRRSFS